MSLTKVSYSMVNGAPVNVLDFGADPTGVADSTAAFNLATKAAQVHTGNNDLNMLLKVYVPAGIYLINGTVYVRKGQHLYGDGNGSTKITTPNTTTGRNVFVLGYGIPGGVETEDPGGLPPVVSDLYTIGGDTTGAFISAPISGYVIRDVFMTFPGVGIIASGGDGLISNIIVDQCLTGIYVRGQNIVISDSIFYVSGNGIWIANATYDVQINNCHFEYSTISDIYFALGATSIQNISVSDCQFVQNTQHTTMTGVNIAGSGVTATFNNCSFRNSYNAGLQTTAGSDQHISVIGCIFDGTKTVPGYAQSTTAKGIKIYGGNWTIKGCVFKYLKAAPVELATIAYASEEVRIQESTFFANTNVTTCITVSGTGGNMQINECSGDLPIVNTQTSVSVTVKTGNTLSNSFDSIASGGARAISMPNNLQVGGGGQLTIVGRSYLATPSDVAGLYLLTGSTGGGTVITLNAIANVAVTYNATTGVVTITNNAANQLDISYFLTYL